MAAHTQDDGFREIQLNGKQLVFLFMAATVVSVVIFLCGVLVGRGVRTERAGGADNAAAVAAVEPTTPTPAPAAAPPAAGSDPTKAAPPPAVEELSYPDRLQKANPPAEELKASAKAVTPPKPEKLAPAPAAKSAVASAAPTEKTPIAPPAASTAIKDVATASKEAAPTAGDASPVEPKGNGYAVQVAALNVRSEADAIAKRLALKGYEAYVLSPASGTPQVYRVRVGKFGSRREAETLATKLQKEEQFKPWVTR